MISDIFVVPADFVVPAEAHPEGLTTPALQGGEVTTIGHHFS